MQTAIPTGTILQNRYRVLSILGQGGFGRTYLAEDQGRFNELCALKELMPPQDNAYALEKSKELFQREAQVLYGIQHPQIPQFRATFAQDQRFFLVQDYVEGKTYRALLDERKSQGFVFTENEVLQLVRQVLPVLAYIHSKGIIHRDIAPDNVILRESDRLPVLIDFGVVKELATRIQSPDTVRQHTTVGKLGYAPTEQMQTGRAYPNSDLYALAVTAVVLLTGREPQELFDETTMTWRWQRLITIDPGFSQVLNKMLSYRTTDRFQSANEVLQALQSPASVAPMPQTPPPIATPPIQPQPPINSQMETMAVGRSALDPANADTSINRAEPTIPTRSSLWDDPWAVGAIGTGLVLLTGLGSWTLVRTLMNPAPPSPSPTQTTVTSPSPTTTPTTKPSPSPSPSPTNDPVTFSQRLNVADGKPESRDGTLRSNETLNFIVPGQQGQQLNAALTSEGVLMTVLTPNKEVVDDRSTRVSNWSGELPFTGDYFVQLRTVQGLAKSNFKLNVSLKNPPAPSPTPSPTVSPSPDPGNPTIQTERVNIPAGQTGTQLSGNTSPRVIRRYLINAQKGQVLSARLGSGNATLTIRYPDGRPVEDASGTVQWQAQLPIGGDYQVDVVANGSTDFLLDINVQY
ncbi:protein kinase domain-containing protein [Phormidesmis priestleyi]